MSVQDSPQVSLATESISRLQICFLEVDKRSSAPCFPSQKKSLARAASTNIFNLKSSLPIAPIHICCKLFLLNVLMTHLLKASQTVPASLAIKSMTFMDREIFETESSTIFTDIRRLSLKLTARKDRVRFNSARNSEFCRLKWS